MHATKTCSVIFLLAMSSQIKSEDNESSDEIEDKFLSHLSEELKERLSTLTKDGPIDMNLLDTLNLSEDEKKELQNALIKSFEPMLGQFMETLLSSGLPLEVSKMNISQNNDKINIDDGIKKNSANREKEVKEEL